MILWATRDKKTPGSVDLWKKGGCTLTKKGCWVKTKDCLCIPCIPFRIFDLIFGTAPKPGKDILEIDITGKRVEGEDVPREEDTND